MRVLVLCCVLLTFVAAETDHDQLGFAVTPKNTCAMPGDAVELQCSLGTDGIQNWEKPFQDVISQNANITAKYKGKYAIKGKYNLEILKPVFKDAGTYRCGDSDNLSQQFQAEVIILESSQRIISSAPGDLILENKKIRYTCEVRYAGNITPSMRWTISSLDMLIYHETDNQPGLAQTYIEVTGDTLMNGESFTCTMLFKEPVVLHDFVASNAPECTMKTRSGILNVHYKPRNTLITHPNGSKVESGANVYTGDVLQCQTDSNPKPVKYEWIITLNNTSKIIGHRSTLTLQEEQIGEICIRCTVTNHMGRDSNTKGSDTIEVPLNMRDHGLDAFTVTPKNRCGFPGDDVKLMCSLDADVIQYWKGPSGEFIFNNYKIQEKYNQKYAILGKYDLLIVGFESMDAGTYSCGGTETKRKAFQAEMIVLEKSLSITSNSTCNVILENEIIRYTCEVRYAGNITPSMRWTLTSSDTEINHETDNQPGLARTYIDVTGESLTNKENVKCSSFFGAPIVSGIFKASNAPDCTMKTSSGILTVHYKPRNTTITFHDGSTVESGATVHAGDLLWCHTDSNPKLVTYEWIAVVGKERRFIGDSQIVFLQEDLVGITSIRCTVTNNMGCDLNTKGSDSMEVHLSMTHSSKTGVSRGEIAGIVIGGIGIIGLFLAGIAAVLLWKRHLNKGYLNPAHAYGRTSREELLDQGKS